MNNIENIQVSTKRNTSAIKAQLKQNASALTSMASLVLEVEKLKIGETTEKEQKEDFQTIFDVYHSDDTCEESSLTRLMLSYLEDYDNLKTMAAFRTIGRKYKDCLRGALVKAKMKLISEVKEKYKWKDNPPFIQAAFNGNIRDVRILLLEDCMDVNQKNKYESTALGWASRNGHIHVVNLLLQQKNMIVNQQNNRGHTALHIASFMEHIKHIEIVKLLLKHSDIDVNIKDNEGKTPLKHASDIGHMQIMELLKAKGGLRDSPFIDAAYDGNVEDVRILLSEDGMDVTNRIRMGGQHYIWHHMAIERLKLSESF